MMSNTIYKSITSYYDRLVTDPNHRYKSWEHCYRFFIEDEDTKNIDISCLHLAFYLASWGMYRGSSFLLWKDYKVHEEVVEKILQYKHLQNIDFSSFDSIPLSEILSLAEWIKNWYRNNINLVNGDLKIINTTDTLMTKILLGTLACVPAYDRYYIDGMRKSGISFSKINKKNLKNVIKYYQEHKNEFNKAQEYIYTKSNFYYPAMKLVDMYFWEIGFKKSKIK